LNYDGGFIPDHGRQAKMMAWGCYRPEGDIQQRDQFDEVCARIAK
jgi:hypothetical protein